MRVYVTFLPRWQGDTLPQYHCVVTAHGRSREVWIEPPEIGWTPVDSSEAFDAAAQCAIEAADHEHPDDGIYEACDVAESGLVLHRAA